MANSNITRGYGLLETYLSKRRSNQAEKLIKKHNRSGILLDIGCGQFPYFLTSTDFSQKYGIDKFENSVVDHVVDSNINLIHYDVASFGKVPFDDNFFDSVTMLAFIEHIAPNQRGGIFAEIHRVLKPGGQMVLTTPAEWTGWILELLAFCRLVSRHEIGDHKGPLDLLTAKRLLLQSGFTPECIRHGYFEAGMNMWMTALKY